MCTEPSRLYSTLNPMRDSTVGSCASAGRYSLCTIDGGTFQVGLTVMYFIAAVSSGRSEERRVGKECRSRWWPYQWKKKKKEMSGGSRRTDEWYRRRT